MCDLLGVTVDQMNNVLEHKTFEELPFIMKDPLFVGFERSLKEVLKPEGYVAAP